MTLRKEPAFSQASTMLIPLILVVPLGIGTIKFAFHAQKDGSSMTKRSVLQLKTTVTLTINSVFVHLAIKATVLTTACVFQSTPFAKPSMLMELVLLVSLKMSFTKDLASLLVN